jgi:N-acetylmuramoyl-L-alanine amidase
MRQAAANASTDDEEAEADEQPAPQAQYKSADPVKRASAPQPVRRVRRKAKRARTAVSMIGGLLRTVIIVVVAAGLMSTIFTWWTPNEFISPNARQSLSIAVATGEATQVPTVLPTPNWARRIGIVSGHRGNDSGAVCPDGLTEASINLSVAELVVRNLRGLGYTVDLLDEFDPRLTDYQAAAMVSIHSNTCQDFGEHVSGFIVAASAGRITARAGDDGLVDCIAQHYASTTQLDRRLETTVDMTDYHTFREIHALTPAAIIELGFMLGDRDLLTGHPDTLARGIADGVLCFLEP